MPDLADSWPDDPENGLDGDNDGLSNYAERTAHHTNPADVDSDDDFLTDYEELLTFHTNPLAARTNLSAGQTLLDGQVHLGVDSDADGLPDLLEDFYAALGHGLSKSSAADAAGDLDSDGTTNLQAYHLGWSLIANLHVYDQDGDGIDNAIEDYWNAVYPGSMSKAVFEDAVADYDGDGLMNFEEVNRTQIGGYLVPLDPGDARSIMTALDYPVTSATITDGQFMAWWWDVNRVDYDYDTTVSPPTPLSAPMALQELVDEDSVANGIPDGYERWGGVAARAVLPDEDGDGMPNVWEYRYALNLRNGGDAGVLDGKQINTVTPGAEPMATDSKYYIPYPDGTGGYYDYSAYQTDHEAYLQLLAAYPAAEEERVRCDPDNDGLSNVREFLLGTHPRIADTDGDGFNDYAEATYGGDPLAAGSKPPVVFSLVSGGGQTVEGGKGSSLPLVVSVTQAGVGVSGVSVTFATFTGIVWPGTGSGAARTLPTGTNGMVETYIAGALSLLAGAGNMLVSAPGFADILVPVTTIAATPTGGGTNPGGGTTNPGPPPPEYFLFSALRYKSVNFDGEETPKWETTPVVTESTPTWYIHGDPPETTPPSDDGFNGDADLQNQTADPGDPRDERQPAPLPPEPPRIPANEGDEGAFLVDETTSSGGEPDGPHTGKYPMNGIYKARNAYFPPDTEEDASSSFSVGTATGTMDSVPFQQGGAENGWMGNGPLGLASYQAFSSWSRGTGTHYLPYIDEIGDEQVSEQDYDFEHAQMSHMEVRLQTNKDVDPATMLPLSAIYIILKETSIVADSSPPVTENVATVKFSITTGKLSDTLGILSGALHAPDMTVTGGTISVRSPQPQEGKIVRYRLLPVKLTLRAAKGETLTPGPENTSYEQQTLSNTTNKLGELPMGTGRSESFGNTYCAPVEVYAEVPVLPNVTWTWKRSVKFRYWHILLNRAFSPNGQGPLEWQVSEVAFVEDPTDDPLLVHTDVIRSPDTGRIYCGDSAGVNIPMQAGALPTGGFYYEESQFIYNLQCSFQGQTFKAATMHVGQKIAMKRISETHAPNGPGGLAPDFNGIENSNAVRILDLSASTDEIRAVVGGSAPIKGTPNP